MLSLFSSIRHIFTRSKAWSLPYSAQLTNYIKGFSYFPGDVKEHVDQVWFDIFPDTTRELSKWEQQFNITPAGTVSERIENLAGRWHAQGGQGLDYLQDLIHDSGFPQVFLHEWGGRGPAFQTYTGGPNSDTGSPLAETGVIIQNGGITARNPNQILVDLWRTYTAGPDSDTGSPLAETGVVVLNGSENLLVNKGPEVASFDFQTYTAGPDSDTGSPLAETGARTGVSFAPVSYDIPQDEESWRFFIYVGGETFPDIAEVPLERKDEFERILLKFIPFQQWIGLLINYV